MAQCTRLLSNESYRSGKQPTYMRDQPRRVFYRKALDYGRFPDRSRSGMQPWGSSGDYAERRIRPDKLGADRGSRRDGFRSAIVVGCQSRDQPRAPRISRLCEDQYATVEYEARARIQLPVIR